MKNALDGTGVVRKRSSFSLVTAPLCLACLSAYEVQRQHVWMGRLMFGTSLPPWGAPPAPAVAVPDRSACLLVKDLVELLDNSHGSPGEYRCLVRELWALDRSLLQVDLLCRVHQGSPELETICTVAQRTVKECQQSLEELSERIQKYAANFQRDGSGEIFKDAAMKLRWHLSEKGVVAKFRKTIGNHVNALNILLASANV